MSPANRSLLVQAASSAAQIMMGTVVMQGFIRCGVWTELPVATNEPLGSGVYFKPEYPILVVSA